MSGNQRQAIRAAVAVRLAAIPSTPLVRNGRILPEQRVDLPAVNILTGAEDVELRTAAGSATVPIEIQRQVMLYLDCRVSADAALDGADALAAEVETAMALDATLGGVTDWLTYEGTDEPEAEPVAEEDVVTLRMNYRAWYRASDA